MARAGAGGFTRRRSSRRAGLRGGAHPPGNIADCRRTHPLDTAGVGAPVRVLESRLVWVCPAEPV